MMGKCNNPEIFSVFYEHDRIRKPFDQNSPGTKGWGKINDWRGGKWCLEKTLHTLVDCGSELRTKATELPVVPLFRLDQFVLRFVEDDEASAHSRRRSSRSRTSDQGRPFASPDCTRSARR